MGILENVSLFTWASYALESQTDLSGLHPIEFEHQKKTQETVAIENKRGFIPAGTSKLCLVHGLHV